MGEGRDIIDRAILPENSARATEQSKQPIQVIVGNPPYAINQGNATSYEFLNRRIRDTYAYYSKSTNRKSLYDSYIRAFRWASDRIGDKGVVAFVSNGGWIDGDATSGFRKCIQDEFSSVYVFHLRGDAHTQGEERQKEKDNVFGEGSRSPIAITMLIKDPADRGPVDIFFYDIGDYLSRGQKMDTINSFATYRHIDWSLIEPNSHGDWVNQRNDHFYEMKPVVGDKDFLFSVHSLGVATNRDSWVYNFSSQRLENNVLRTLRFYERETYRIAEKIPDSAKQSEKEKIASKEVLTDVRECKWTRGLKQNAARQRFEYFSLIRIKSSLYRPFFKQNIYHSRLLNEAPGKMSNLFPTPHHENLLIQIPGTSASNKFSCLITNVIPDLNALPGGSQCLPLYYYEKPSNSDRGLFGDSHDDYICRDGITDTALKEIRIHYGDDTITKEAIFYYTYGVLHSPAYREQFANELKKELPRIPYAPDFWGFSQAGRDLAYWHLNYETVEPYPLNEHSDALAIDPEELYKVHKMRFAGKSGSWKKSTVFVNNHVTLSDIPDEAHQYVVNGKTPVEWVIDRYQYRKDKDTGIVNDPNEWSDDPRYIVDLVKRVVRVSVETVRIVNSLPEIE